ncbi:uncharacterized protein LOC115739083 isoform X4 [Rhodamnia argentea]|uniref:Uncharacterized protein LOC115739083 isoform X4 n=1 Tax=Rhodamnia argentea TaxID=178133 RepID=A0A8B8NZV4_9MYRT|nr:uncharacterized protein LOC115739083 isoform X4 [Rhodamnia argentea]
MRLLLRPFTVHTAVECESFENDERDCFLSFSIFPSPARKLCARSRLLSRELRFPNDSFGFSRENLSDQMFDKRNEDFYMNFSRRELQTLCKKYGLPANRSKSDLANLLASRSQECNLRPLSQVHRDLQLRFAEKEGPGASVTGDYGSISFPQDKDVRQWFHHTVRANQLEGSVEAQRFDEGISGDLLPQHAETSYSQFSLQSDSTGFHCGVVPRMIPCEKEVGLHGSGAAECMSQIQFKDITAGAFCAADVVSASVYSAMVPSSSFEFHVRSEEGISLHVDLNLSPSDWAEKLKNDVCIFESVNCMNNQSSREELGHLGENNVMKSSPSQTADNSQIAAAPSDEDKGNSFKDCFHPDRVDSLLISAAEVPSVMDAEVSKGLEEVQMPISTKSESVAQSQIVSPVAPCGMDGRRTSFDPNISDNPDIKSCNDSFSHTISDGTVSFITSDHVAKHGGETCVNSDLENNCKPTNFGATVPEGYRVGSTELHLSKAATLQGHSLSPFKTNAIDFLVDWKNKSESEGESANTFELKRNNDENVPTCSDIEERSSTASGVESIVCWQFEKSSARSSSRYDDVDSGEMLQKRLRVDSDDQSDCVGMDVRISRCSKHPNMEVLPRRSVRLVPKELSTGYLQRDHRHVV